KLGETFAELGSTPPTEFEEILRLRTWQHASAQIAKLDELLALYGGQPKFWSDDVKRYQRIAQQAIGDRYFMVPIDLEEAFGGEAGLIVLQRLIRRFGELLQVWPSLYDA